VPEHFECSGLKIVVKSADVAIWLARHELAQRVVGELRGQFPNETLLCFLDDEDWPTARNEMGAARGFYTPTRNLDRWLLDYQDYVGQALDKNAIEEYQNFVYLFGSTCSIREGLAMTLAHELQHFIQHGTSKKTWAIGSLASILIRNLSMTSVNEAGVSSWCDVPIERQAWISGKRVAAALLGGESVRRHIDAQIATVLCAVDLAAWKAIRKIDASKAYDFATETASFIPRLSAYRNLMEQCLADLRDDPDFADLDINPWVRGVGQ
jgi:hypothetical protein